MEHNKMRIWENVCTTDPKYTKYVNQRGGFTAIDAQYQMQTATEQFGPMGWGWGVKDETFNFIEGMVIYQAILFYHYGSDGDTIKENEIPLHSSMQVKPDCVKSVATDALTKGLSKLGFNADVFLGKFDDNKYVNNLKKKYADKPKNESTPNDDGSFNPPTQPKPNQGINDALEGKKPLLNGQVNKAMKKMNGESNGQAESSDNELDTSIDGVCMFPKYQGIKWSEVAKKDDWYIGIIHKKSNLDDTTRTIVNHYYEQLNKKVA